MSFTIGLCFLLLLLLLLQDAVDSLQQHGMQAQLTQVVTLPSLLQLPLLHQPLHAATTVQANDLCPSQCHASDEKGNISNNLEIRTVIEPRIFCFNLKTIIFTDFGV